nr:immunoglobulin heavy chain junction region [Macaca mulatta]MOV38390.1 immunoglobulin heavy chain junction region [Macaca mulatta]MOV39617.1 immunoglobulin heavy chain junction region [Macaca mulatta]MOV40075.1 immunoglobulin heavy chain junction region [Macaca mulatta]MOV40154.1 immunoglobulin heavy chain junction region [Macaca mulatta]
CARITAGRDYKGLDSW